MTIRIFTPYRGAAWILLLAALVQPAGAGAGGAAISSAAARDLAEVARSLPKGGALRIEGTALEGLAASSGLDLARFQVAADDARFVLQTEAGPTTVQPDLPVYLRGSVDGLRGSVAVLSVRSSGEVRGVVSTADGTWMLSRRAGGTGLRSRRVDRAAIAANPDFSCEVLDNPVPRRPAAAALSQAPSSERSLRLPVSYTAQVAVELDHDYYGIFAPDAGAAVLYALDLMAFTGALGESELGMNVQVPFVQLWTTESDPYSGSTTSRLGQLRSRWNQGGATNCGGIDCTTIERSTVLLLSEATSGGVAYVPGLCDSHHSPTGGASYAFAGSLRGTFDVDSPAAVWDIIVTTHELGHNFGSSHTHCYSPPVDGCYGDQAGCYAGEDSLPPGCPGNGQGCGTLMSYCHLLAGGTGNISLTYGAGHPYGDAPERVPDQMISTIASEAAAAPACLTATGGMAALRVTKAGVGDGAVTSSPAGLDCGSTCRTRFGADTVVTLTAVAGEFSTFTGWSGDADCSDGTVTLAADVECTATFEGNCGAANENCDDHLPCTQDSCPGDDHCENAEAPRAASACFESPRTKLKLIDVANDPHDKLSWQWRTGAAFAQDDLGNPSSDTAYTLCIYDTSGGVSRLATSLTLPAGGVGWKNLWKNRSPRGWDWNDRHAYYDGLRRLQLKTGEEGRSKVKLSALHQQIPLPGPFSADEYFDGDPAVVVQLLAGEEKCWTSSFAPSGTNKNTATSFSASGD